MTDSEPQHEPTFSHQEMPAKPATAATVGPEAIGTAIAEAQRALESRQRIVEADDLVERKRALQPVVDALPPNGRRPRAELIAKMPAKLRGALDGWGWDSGNLLILGPSGAGKTTGAAYLVRRVCARAAALGGVEFGKAQLIRWQSCRDLSQLVREHPLGQGVPDAVQRCQNARLLVLDDVGGNDDKGALERILNTRYERCWPTVTTSGLSSHELVDAFGEALVRRMLQRGGQDGRIIKLEAPPPMRVST
jgi:hypothetical protein